MNEERLFGLLERLVVSTEALAAQGAALAAEREATRKRMEEFNQAMPVLGLPVMSPEEVAAEQKKLSELQTITEDILRAHHKQITESDSWKGDEP